MQLERSRLKFSGPGTAFRLTLTPGCKTQLPSRVHGMIAGLSINNMPVWKGIFAPPTSLQQQSPLPPTPVTTAAIKVHNSKLATVSSNSSVEA